MDLVFELRNPNVSPVDKFDIFTNNFHYDNQQIVHVPTRSRQMEGLVFCHLVWQLQTM